VSTVVIGIRGVDTTGRCASEHQAVKHEDRVCNIDTAIAVRVSPEECWITLVRNVVGIGVEAILAFQVTGIRHTITIAVDTQAGCDITRIRGTILVAIDIALVRYAVAITVSRNSRSKVTDIRAAIGVAISLRDSDRHGLCHFAAVAMIIDSSPDNAGCAMIEGSTGVIRAIEAVGKTDDSAVIGDRGCRYRQTRNACAGRCRLRDVTTGGDVRGFIVVHRHQHRSGDEVAMHIRLSVTHGCSSNLEGISRKVTGHVLAQTTVVVRCRRSPGRDGTALPWIGVENDVARRITELRELVIGDRNRE